MEIERTRQKLREVQFFLRHLEEEVLASDGSKPREAIEHYLSAFLAAARSVTNVLEAEVGEAIYRPWSGGWRATLTEDERKVLAKFTAARNRALKRGTPSVQTQPLPGEPNVPPELQFFFEQLDDEAPFPLTSGREAKVRLTPQHAQEDVLPTCSEYAALLARLVTAFQAAHPA